jgi:hypothetical protein
LSLSLPRSLLFFFLPLTCTLLLLDHLLLRPFLFSPL